MTRIASVEALEVLDSRGRPTVEAKVVLVDGTVAAASVPSGVSKGSHEAHELRDGDPRRYGGRGVRRAVENVSRKIGPALVGLDARDQEAVDARLLDLDGTPEKSRLGANAILAVSLAAARAAATSRSLPLWRHLRGDAADMLPLPMVNVLSGALHACGNLDFQDFLIVPVGAVTYAQALETCVAVRDATAALLEARGLSTLKADEGGFAPVLPSAAAALELLVEAVERVGRAPGEDVALALDVAATHFHDPARGTYKLARAERALDAAALVVELEALVDRFPLVSIEDPLAEDDWEGWRIATDRLGPRVQLVGDDLFATNPERLRAGIKRAVANALLVKMNQVGTLTETRRVVEAAHAAGYRTVVSARSGETEDSALADLAVAFGADQIKVGSVAQSERLAKYNQLLRIEAALGGRARLAGWPTENLRPRYERV